MDTTKKTPQEGSLTEKIENVTGKVPSTVYLVASIAAMATSLTLKCMGKKHDALLVGQWAAPFLLLGIYNKLVKQGGHDSESEPKPAHNY